MDVSDLIASIDIVDYLSQFTEFTQKNGEYWALSPLKQERTPSFSVRREKNQFYDFSSGVGGNVLTFTRHYFGCSYAEAVERLKSYAGIQGELCVPSKLSAAAVARRYTRPHRHAKGKKATALPDDYMQRFERRADKLAVWKREGISDASLEKFQVRYDGFSNRIVFPVRSPAGTIVNVCGRTLEADWKEKKLRKYTYYHPWGELDTIYGLAENRAAIEEKREIILFEGCKSVLLADSWGVFNTGAILTSHLNPHQIEPLIKLSCRVVFALDKDVIVRDDRNIRRLKPFVPVQYIWDGDNLLDEKDAPVDRGKAVWQRLYEGRRTLR